VEEPTAKKRDEGKGRGGLSGKNKGQEFPAEGSLNERKGKPEAKHGKLKIKKENRSKKESCPKTKRRVVFLMRK